MGTTATSGWALFWFLLGFTMLGTSQVGGGWLSVLGGLAMIGLSCVVFQSARTREDA